MVTSATLGYEKFMDSRRVNEDDLNNDVHPLSGCGLLERSLMPVAVGIFRKLLART